jgi:uncharacterized protein (TIGR02266 family)
MLKERRAHPRLDIPLEAEYLVAGEEEWQQGTIWVLGAGGVGLLCEEKLEIGTVLEGLRFAVEAEEDLPEIRIEVGAEVVNLDPKAGFGSQSNFILGLQFRGLEEQEAELLQQFVFRRLTESRTPSAGAEVESEEELGSPPLEIRFNYLDDFVGEVSENLSPSGMFIRADNPRPPGSRFAFRFKLGDDFSLFKGTAEVVFRRPQGKRSKRPVGMGVRFLTLDLTSQKVIKRMVAQREAAEAESSPPRVKPAESAVPFVIEGAPPAPAATEARPGADEAAAVAAAGEAVSAKLRRRVEGLEKGLAEADAARDQAEDRCNRLSEEVASLHEKILALESAAEEAEKEKGRTEAEIAELRRELESREPDSELTEELRQSRAELERLQEEWESREQELRAELERSLADDAEIQQRLERASEVEEELRQRVAAVEPTRRAAHKLMRRTVEITEERDELRTQLDQLRSDKSELEDRLNEETALLSKVRNTVGEMASRLNGDLTAARAATPAEPESASDPQSRDAERDEELAEPVSNTLERAPTGASRLAKAARRTIARLGFPAR